MSEAPTTGNAPAPRACAPWWFSWTVWLVVVVACLNVARMAGGDAALRHPVTIALVVVLARHTRRLASRHPPLSLVSERKAG